MKEMEKLQIFKRVYDYSKWLLNHTNKFPKSHRFSVAVKLENTVLEIIELITQANMRLGFSEEIELHLGVLTPCDENTTPGIKIPEIFCGENNSIHDLKIVAIQKQSHIIRILSRE